MMTGLTRVQTESIPGSSSDDVQECPSQQLHTVTFKEDSNEAMLRTSIEGLSADEEWESFEAIYKSGRSLEPPYIVKVVAPILTIDAG